MPVTSDTTILKDGTAIIWSAEFRVEGENVILEWIRARTADNEFNTHWPVGSTIVQAVAGGELTGALRASIDHHIEVKHADQPFDRRLR